MQSLVVNNTGPGLEEGAIEEASVDMCKYAAQTRTKVLVEGVSGRDGHYNSNENAHDAK